MKTYIEVQNGQPLGNLFIEGSLPHMADDLRGRLVQVVRSEKPATRWTHKCAEQPSYELSTDGLVYERWEVREWTKEELADMEPRAGREGQLPYYQAAGEVRRRRDQLLLLCDWTQIADAQLTEEKRAAWSAYRQALRDVPEQPDFPWQVTWPTAP